MLSSLPWLRPLILALAIAAVAGCASLLGIDEFDNSTAGGGSGGGGGDGGTGGSSEGGGGSNSGSESCLDRVDNNSDGLADCEDPLCQDDHECVALTTGDWLGIGWLYEGDPMADCPLGQRLELYDEADLVVPTPTCTCGCDDPATTSCEATLRCSATSCGGSPLATAIAATTCSPLILTLSNQDCQASNLHAVAGPCTVAGRRQGEAIEWPAAASICVYDDGGHCPGQDTCVPQSTASAQGPCVAQLGEQACPPGYPVKLLYWDGLVDDHRSCSTNACSCGFASGETCACTNNDPCGIRAYHTSSCSGPGTFATMDGVTCATYGAISGGGPWTFGIVLEGTEVTNPGSCTPSGSSQLQGAATPATRITVCCSEASR